MLKAPTMFAKKENKNTAGYSDIFDFVCTVSTSLNIFGKGGIFLWSA